jgi:hypothetical protein
VAAHANFVLRSNLAPNSEQEWFLEKVYTAGVSIIMLCVFLPCAVYFYLVEPGIETGNSNFDLLLLVFLVLQWVWVMGICAHMHLRINTQTPVAKVYRRQILLFLVVFLLLTGQTVAFNILEN